MKIKCTRNVREKSCIERLHWPGQPVVMHFAVSNRLTVKKYQALHHGKNALSTNLLEITSHVIDGSHRAITQRHNNKCQNSSYDECAFTVFTVQ